jgi:hypothetical protein
MLRLDNAGAELHLVCELLSAILSGDIAMCVTGRVGGTAVSRIVESMSSMALLWFNECPDGHPRLHELGSAPRTYRSM